MKMCDRFDIKGSALNINDVVYIANSTNMNFKECIITRFTDKRIKLRDVNHIIYYREPNQVIKVGRCNPLLFNKKLDAIKVKEDWILKEKKK